MAKNLDVQTIQKVNAKPGDAIIVRYPATNPTAHEYANALAKWLQDSLPAGVSVCTAPDALSVQIVSAAPVMYRYEGPTTEEGKAKVRAMLEKAMVADQRRAGSIMPKPFADTIPHRLGLSEGDVAVVRVVDGRCETVKVPEENRDYVVMHAERLVGSAKVGESLREAARETIQEMLDEKFPGSGVKVVPAPVKTLEECLAENERELQEQIGQIKAGTFELSAEEQCRRADYARKIHDQIERGILGRSITEPILVSAKQQNEEIWDAMKEPMTPAQVADCERLGIVSRFAKAIHAATEAITCPSCGSALVLYESLSKAVYECPNGHEFDRATFETPKEDGCPPPDVVVRPVADHPPDAVTTYFAMEDALAGELYELFK